MAEKKDEKITPKDQHQPEPTRKLFIEGALKEAVVQGYGVEAQGRILVLALRTYEGR